MAKDLVAPVEGGALISVWTVPGASSTEVVGVHDGALKVRVAAPAEGGKANRRLEEHLEALLGAEVRVDKGTTSRRKVLFVASKDISVVRRKLGLDD